VSLTAASVDNRARRAVGLRLRGCAIDLEGAQLLFDPAGTYLDTASYALPPRTAWDALQAALEDWRGGRASWQSWCDATEQARAAFARLANVAPGDVATGATVSGLVGIVAASLPPGTRVVLPDREFASTLFPFLAQERSGLRVDTVPLAQLADAAARADVVAFSAVQMTTGEVADLDAIEAAADAAGAVTVVDATHGAGWLPLDASRFDVVVAAGYKWLLSPRGTAYMTVRRERLAELVPLAANWYAGEDRFGTYAGPPLRLATDARRLDTSPAWHAWVGAAPAVELLADLGAEAVHAHDLALANRFRAALGLEPGRSAIVMVERPDAAARLERAGIRAASLGGGIRTSWHVHNTEDDVERALDALSA